MEISERLKAEIEQQFQEMKADSNEQETEPGQDVFDWLFSIERKKTSPATKRKQRQRTRDKDLKALSILREKMPDEYYQSIKASIMAEYERDPKQRGPKTKATTDLNNFLYICYYLIKKENLEAKDIKLYRWIKEYLKDKDYRMKDKKSFYDTDAIKTRMQYYKKLQKENPATIKAINSYIDDVYNRFVPPSD